MFIDQIVLPALVLTWVHLIIECGGHSPIWYLPEIFFANVAGNVNTVHTTAEHAKMSFRGSLIKTGDQPACPPYLRRRYRQLDGRCNHWLDLGAAGFPVKRYLPPHYQDKYGVSGPRQYSVEPPHRALPASRAVSVHVHQEKHRTDSHTLLVMQLGQFIDHDITSAPVHGEKSSIKCCDTLKTVDERDHCFPITIPDDDPRFSPRTCMEFVRSLPATAENGDMIYPREQLNVLTSFVDGSVIYGSDKEMSMKLRTNGGKGALLKTKQVSVGTGWEDRLPEDTHSDCISTGRASGAYCQLAGDERVNEHPYLGSIHTMFHLYHNHVVRRLVKAILTPRHRDVTGTDVDRYITLAGPFEQEKLYQEARKIVGGVLQKIVYCDWLPIIVGPHLINKYKLSCDTRSSYNSSVDPRIANVFLSAAFRFGHSLIPNDLLINHQKQKLETMFMIPDASIKFYHSNLQGMVANGSQEMCDRHVSSSVSQHLFETKHGPQGALDLVALNIQRGRDHGIPSYHYWRLKYGLSGMNSWGKFEVTMRNKLSNLYRTARDVDLYPGGLAEPPVTGGIVGETFGHIIAHQFSDLKFGDAHFFSHFTADVLPQGFTTAQLKALKSVHVPHIMCHSSRIGQVQVNPFLAPQPSTNPILPCSSFPDIDVGPWMKYWP